MTSGPPAEQVVLILLFMSQPVFHPVLQVLLVKGVRDVLKQCCNNYAEVQMMEKHSSST